MSAKGKRNKGQSRIRILEAAAKLFRTKGFSATGVDELMAEAGLTAGGFYAHFKSKQDLFDQTLSYMLSTSASRLVSGVDLSGGNKKSVDTVLARYVSCLHRDNPEHGCAIPAIASEIARHSKRGKEIIGDYVGLWADMMEKNLGPQKDTREEGLRLIAQAVGAVLLSRLVPARLSGEILSAAAKRGR